MAEDGTIWISLADAADIVATGEELHDEPTGSRAFACIRERSASAEAVKIPARWSWRISLRCRLTASAYARSPSGGIPVWAWSNLGFCPKERNKNLGSRAMVQSAGDRTDESAQANHQWPGWVVAPGVAEGGSPERVAQLTK